MLYEIKYEHKFLWKIQEENYDMFSVNATHLYQNTRSRKMDMNCCGNTRKKMKLSSVKATIFVKTLCTHILNTSSTWTTYEFLALPTKIFSFV